MKPAKKTPSDSFWMTPIPMTEEEWEASFEQFVAFAEANPGVVERFKEMKLSELSELMTKKETKK
jgi:hypothetical protein